MCFQAKTGTFSTRSLCFAGDARGSREWGEGRSEVEAVAVHKPC